MDKLTAVFQSPSIALYRIEGESRVVANIVSTPQTRRIANDPTCAGVEYTTLLEQACCEVFKLKPVEQITQLRDIR